MSRRGVYALVLGALGATAAVLRHRRGHATAHTADGGILVADAVAYDALTGVVFRSFTAGVAADVAAVAPDGARVLDVGCGPGHLALALARRHQVEVTGVDLDPAMIERAEAHAGDLAGNAPRPTFAVADVTSLAFPDASFDVVVSTLSMHHWADPGAGLAEIARVLRPTGRALVWDLRPGMVPFHPTLPDPAQHTAGSALHVVAVTPWRWPWRLALTQRIELAGPDG